MAFSHDFTTPDVLFIRNLQITTHLVGTSHERLLEELDAQLAYLYKEFERKVVELYESLRQLHEIFQHFIEHLHELANAQLVNEAEFARLQHRVDRLESLILERNLLV
ncbi:hypothetical protein [Synechococcus sp. UW69]|uniref:hypothetical protein n=1 Tax=Synechococcus sp. UW69 TaxID=368493 RepID=UPI000E0E454C|nr:hypothetical protein [Synechococcus sp. UW69]